MNKPITTKEEDRAHRAWLAAGRKGPGRVVWTGEDRSGGKDAGVSLVGAHLFDCNFSDAALPLSDLAEIEVDHCNFDGADLRSNIKSSRWRMSTLRGAELGGARFDGSRFERCDFSRANFNRTDLTRCEALDTSFHTARFQDALLDHARFERCTFRDATFTISKRFGNLAHAVETTFIECDLRGVTFDRYKLARCRFEGCLFDDLAGPATLDGDSIAIDCHIAAPGEDPRPIDWQTLKSLLLRPR